VTEEDYIMLQIRILQEAHQKTLEPYFQRLYWIKALQPSPPIYVRFFDGPNPVPFGWEAP